MRRSFQTVVGLMAAFATIGTLGTGKTVMADNGSATVAHQSMKAITGSNVMYEGLQFRERLPFTGSVKMKYPKDIRPKFEGKPKKLNRLRISKKTRLKHKRRG